MLKRNKEKVNQTKKGTVMFYIPNYILDKL